MEKVHHLAVGFEISMPPAIPSVYFPSCISASFPVFLSFCFYSQLKMRGLSLLLQLSYVPSCLLLCCHDEFLSFWNHKPKEFFLL